MVMTRQSSYGDQGRKTGCGMFGLFRRNSHFRSYETIDDLRQFNSIRLLFCHCDCFTVAVNNDGASATGDPALI
jgi:hypothetical protein